MDIADMARSDLQSREAAEGAEEPELEAEPSLVPTLPMIEPALLNVRPAAPGFPLGRSRAACCMRPPLVPER